MTTYNPQIHNRRSIRLKGYDYSLEGAYFITICCQDRLWRFGEVHEGKMQLNEYGIIAHKLWSELPQYFNNIELDVYQVMPNHMHAILVLTDKPERIRVAARDWVPARGTPTTEDVPTGRAEVTVGDIVGAYKSLVAHGCLEYYKSKDLFMGKLWQRNFYEHIIRNDISYLNIREYIINNPASWMDDTYNKIEEQ